MGVYTLRTQNSSVRKTLRHQCRTIQTYRYRH